MFWQGKFKLFYTTFLVGTVKIFGNIYVFIYLLSFFKYFCDHT